MDGFKIADDAFRFEKETHRYIFDGRVVPSVTQIISDAGFSFFRDVPPDVLRKAADFGTAVHEATEAYDLGMLGNVEPRCMEKVAVWEMIRDELLGSDTPDDTLVEQLVFNKSQFYAGRVDRIYDFRTLHHCIYILDIKTGAYDEKYCGLQLAGYAEAVRSMLGPVAIKTFIADLKAEKLHRITWADYSNYFFSALNVFNFKRR